MRACVCMYVMCVCACMCVCVCVCVFVYACVCLPRASKLLPGDKKGVAFGKGGVRLYKPCTEENVRSAPKLASKSKILARRDHLEQYFINSQISLKSEKVLNFLFP